MPAERKIKVRAHRGDLIVELRAMNALPIEGVMASLQGERIAPDAADDESVARFSLPMETASYLCFGVVTPLKRVFMAPAYERRIYQGDKLLSRARARTRKVSVGQWVGAPDAFGFVVK